MSWLLLLTFNHPACTVKYLRPTKIWTSPRLEQLRCCLFTLQRLSLPAAITNQGLILNYSQRYIHIASRESRKHGIIKMQRQKPLAACKPRLCSYFPCNHFKTNCPGPRMQSTLQFAIIPLQPSTIVALNPPQSAPATRSPARRICGQVCQECSRCCRSCL